MARKKKFRLRKVFRKARVNYPPFIALRIRKAQDFLIFSRSSPDMVRALDEIYTALIILGGPKFNTFDPLKIPSGNAGDWTAALQDLWIRFRHWHEELAKVDIQAREACLLYAKGYNKTEIESLCRIKKDGRVYEKIVNALEFYCSTSGWGYRK